MDSDSILLSETHSYAGPERRHGQAGLYMPVLLNALDEVDYGLVLLTGRREVIYANKAARSALENDHPLMIVNGLLQGRRADNQTRLQNALFVALQRGEHGLLRLGGEPAVTLAVAPMAANNSSTVPGQTVLLTLGRIRLTPTQSLDAFCVNHGLSRRERQVLQALTRGAQPAQIAKQLDVSLATVRSHIHHIKDKTACRSVVALLGLVAMLPPVISHQVC